MTSGRAIIAKGIPSHVHKGTCYVVWDQKRQRYIVRSWPQSAPTETPAMKENRDLYRTVTQLINRCTGEDLIAAQTMAKHTRFGPRDILAKAAYGVLFDEFSVDGTTYRSSRVASSDIQVLLNALGTTEGAMLLYHDGEWQLVVPGTVGQVLTLVGTPAYPDWRDPTVGPTPASPNPFHPGFVSGRIYTGPNSNSPANVTCNSGKIQCTPFYVPVDTTADKLWFHTNVTTTTKFRLGIYKNSGGKPGALEIDFGEITSTTSGLQSISGGGHALAAGWYFLAMNANGAISMIGVSNAGTLTWLNGSTVLNTLTQSFLTTSAYGALPNPHPTPTYNAGNPVLLGISPP